MITKNSLTFGDLRLGTGFTDPGFMPVRASIVHRRCCLILFLQLLWLGKCKVTTFALNTHVHIIGHPQIQSVLSSLLKPYSPMCGRRAPFRFMGQFSER